MAQVNPTPRPKPIDRKRVFKFAHDFCTNVEREFNLFLGRNLKPIIEAQGAINGSEGYRVRERAFFLPYSGIPKVYEIGAMPKGFSRPDALDSSLLVPHLAWLELYEEHMRTWDKVRAGLGSMIAKAVTEQDWRDMFPEHVVKPTLDHEFLQKRIDVTAPDGTRTSSYERLQRTKADVYASGPDSKNWSPSMYPIYARIADHVDTYIGMKFL